MDSAESVWSTQEILPQYSAEVMIIINYEIENTRHGRERIEHFFLHEF